MSSSLSFNNPNPNTLFALFSYLKYRLNTLKVLFRTFSFNKPNPKSYTADFVSQVRSYASTIASTIKDDDDTAVQAEAGQPTDMRAHCPPIEVQRTASCCGAVQIHTCMWCLSPALEARDLF